MKVFQLSKKKKYQKMSRMEVTDGKNYYLAKKLPINFFFTNNVIFLKGWASHPHWLKIIIYGLVLHLFSSILQDLAIDTKKMEKIYRIFMVLKKYQNTKFKFKVKLIHKLWCFDKVFWLKYYSYDEFEFFLSRLTTLQY